jgi:mannose-6-phosphate isomerase-like protein (cupin superfamily)
MGRVLLLLVSALSVSANVSAQTTPAPSAPKATTFKPAALVVQVSDTLGAPLGGTMIEATGPVSREGETAPDGSLRLINLRAGTYRLRFKREGSITFEREVALRAGESSTMDVALSAAPPPPKAPEPVPPTMPTRDLGAPGDPKVTPVPAFLEKNFIGGREARKESPLGCTSSGKATLFQLRDSWLAHQHDDSDEWIYVVAGEGVLRMAAAEHHLQAGTFSLVPHTMTHALIPQGRNPLIVISVLSGQACKN